MRNSPYLDEILVLNQKPVECAKCGGEKFSIRYCAATPEVKVWRWKLADAQAECLEFRCSCGHEFKAPIGVYKVREAK